MDGGELGKMEREGMVISSRRHHSVTECINEIQTPHEFEGMHTSSSYIPFINQRNLSVVRIKDHHAKINDWTVVISFFLPP
ncbi:hypothetical protein X798_02336 [Onchocerca flexuosa]|uniref:Ovule protein n=2 Tax=Onchocerca flexuosa TaxID=387005 RepID=A0A183H912_9BILA|nr:hypothetical protein X798_02336 [Onchocerca flexuosa]VDO38447.1 unnamed protein product [Onchocerca flexuosa]